MLKLGHFEKDQKYLRSFEMWCWGRMENISWTHYAKRNKVLHSVEEESNIELMIKRKRVTWTGHALCTECLLNVSE
jgi:hypothetical protein